MDPNEAKWIQTLSNGGKCSQRLPIKAKEAKWGQTGTNRVKQGQTEL